MPEPESKSTEFESTRSWLDAGSRAFLILYGIGYFVESYYDSRYGLGYINPLRSKVGFTGIAFGLQVITTIVLFKVEEIVNNSSIWLDASNSISGAQSHLLKIPYIATWLVECCLIALALTFIFATNVHGGLSDFGHAVVSLFRGHSAAVPSSIQNVSLSSSHEGPANMKDLFSLAICFLLMVTGGTLVRFRQIPMLLAGLITAIGGVAFLLIFCRFDVEASNVHQIFIGYVAFVALIRLALVLFQRNRPALSIKKRAALFLLALAVPILYAHTIYGDVSPQWGGGHGALVVVQFERNVPPLGLTSRVHMLEETDDGFYLVNANGDHTAIYVPRKDVKEVIYSSTSQPPQAPNAQAQTPPAQTPTVSPPLSTP
jgi:hypothetical protein